MEYLRLFCQITANNLKIIYCKRRVKNWELSKGLLLQERHRQMVMLKDRKEQSKQSNKFGSPPSINYLHY